jgi:hypothetical protein
MRDFTSMYQVFERSLEQQFKEGLKQQASLNRIMNWFMGPLLN